MKYALMLMWPPPGSRPTAAPERKPYGRNAWREDNPPIFVAHYENPPGYVDRKRPDVVRIERTSWGAQVVVYRWMRGLQCWRARYRVGSSTSSRPLREQWVLWSENRRGKRHSR